MADSLFFYTTVEVGHHCLLLVLLHALKSLCCSQLVDLIFARSYFLFSPVQNSVEPSDICLKYNLTEICISFLMFCPPVKLDLNLCNTMLLFSYSPFHSYSVTYCFPLSCIKSLLYLALCASKSCLCTMKLCHLMLSCSRQGAFYLNC